MVWILFWVVGVVNGLGYWWGYCNYELVDIFINFMLWGFWIGGEELYNNYYVFFSLVCFVMWCWEFDIGWSVICLL